MGYESSTGRKRKPSQGLHLKNLQFGKQMDLKGDGESIPPWKWKGLESIEQCLKLRALQTQVMKTHVIRDFPSGTVVKTELPLQGPQVRFLVGKLRSHVP